MVEVTAKKSEPKFFSRVSPEVMEQAQQLANREFDGNVSMLVRVAVKRFIEDRTSDELAERDADELQVA